MGAWTVTPLPDRHQALLNAYATGTLTPEERDELFQAALEDQSLFDALAREQALRELLDEPAARADLLRALDRPQPRWWVARWAWAVCGILVLLALGASLPRWGSRTASRVAEVSEARQQPSPTAPAPVPQDLPTAPPRAEMPAPPAEAKRASASPRQAKEASSQAEQEAAMPAAPASTPASAPAAPQTQASQGQAPASIADSAVEAFQAASPATTFSPTQNVEAVAGAVGRVATAGARQVYQGLLPQARAALRAAPFRDSLQGASGTRARVAAEPAPAWIGMRYSVQREGTAPNIALQVQVAQAGYLCVLERTAEGTWVQALPDFQAALGAQATRTVPLPRGAADRRVVVLFSRQPLSLSGATALASAPPVGQLVEALAEPSLTTYVVGPGPTLVHEMRVGPR